MKILSGVIGLATGFVNGFFGTGGGSVFVSFYKLILKGDTYKAHAMASSVILPITLVSIFFYWQRFNIDYGMVFLVTISGIVGSIIGAKCLTKIPVKLLHTIFGAFLIIAGLKLVF